MQMSGFIGSVRYDQKFIEGAITNQLLWPEFEDDTTINFAFTAESQDERFKRNMEAINVVNTLNISPESKIMVFDKLLVDAGILED